MPHGNLNPNTYLCDSRQLRNELPRSLNLPEKDIPIKTLRI